LLGDINCSGSNNEQDSGERDESLHADEMSGATQSFRNVLGRIIFRIKQRV